MPKYLVGGIPEQEGFITLIDTTKEIDYDCSTYSGKFNFWIKEDPSEIDSIIKYSKMYHVEVDGTEETDRNTFQYPTLPTDDQLGGSENIEKYFATSYNKDLPPLTDPCLQQNYKTAFKNIIKVEDVTVEGQSSPIKQYQIVLFDIEQKIPIGTEDPQAKTFKNLIKTTAKTETIEAEYSIATVQAKPNQANVMQCTETKREKFTIKFAGLGFTEPEADNITIVDVPILV